MQARHVSARISESRRQLDDRNAVEMDRAHDLSLERREALENRLDGQPIEHVVDTVGCERRARRPARSSKEITLTARAIGAYFADLGRGRADTPYDVAFDTVPDRAAPRARARPRPNAAPGRARLRGARNIRSLSRT